MTVIVLSMGRPGDPGQGRADCTTLSWFEKLFSIPQSTVEVVPTLSVPQHLVLSLTLYSDMLARKEEVAEEGGKEAREGKEGIAGEEKKLMRHGKHLSKRRRLA